MPDPSTDQPAQPIAYHGRQKRVLLFVHDGSGLGHLRRVARLAGALQGPCASLVVSGHRAAAWLVPPECEYVHLPSLDSLLPQKAARWGRRPFAAMTLPEIHGFRKKLLDSVVEAFRPDALVVDYLPLGVKEELAEIVERLPARKYLVLRGVLDQPFAVRKEILGGRAGDLLKRCFDRILVACDPRVCDVGQEYGFPPSLAAKLSYVGYIVDPVGAERIEKAREERGLRPGDVWVVGSAGGGLLGEQVAEACLKLSRSLAEPFVFDVIAGPRSRVGAHWRSAEVIWEGRNRHMMEHQNLPLLHAAADIVVTPGGYNSVVEGMEGGAVLLCAPVQADPRDEQFTHTARLTRLYPLQVVRDLDRLGEEVVAAARGLVRRRGRDLLDFDGLAKTRDLIYQDLGIAAPSPTT